MYLQKPLGYAFLPEDQQPSEEELSAMYMDSLNSAIDNHAGDVSNKYCGRDIIACR